MSLSRNFILVLVAVATAAFISCSKKDVKEDEAMSPAGEYSEDSGATVDESAGIDSQSVTSGEQLSSADLERVHFDYDKYNIRSDAKPTLQKNAQWLKSNPTASIQIEGHCDERGTTEYNLALGERRANSVREYLRKLGVEDSRLSVISYGEERPMDTASNEAAWAKNRRADFVVVSK